MQFIWGYWAGQSAQYQLSSEIVLILILLHPELVAVAIVINSFY